MREIPNLMPAPTIKYGDPTDVVSRGTGNLSERKNDISENKRNEVVDPFLENQAEHEEVSMENDICRGKSTPSTPICLEDDDIDMETRNKFKETKTEKKSSGQLVA